jgi:hypothetical protein
MSEFDEFKLGPTPSRVSFSRGLLKYMQEEPEVGRRTGMTCTRYTSTPKDEGTSRDEWWTEKLEKLEKKHKEEVDWQEVRIKHLEILLDGERRMVDTLNKFAEIPRDYQKARIDTHRTSLEVLPMDLDSVAMPELITIDGVREELGRKKMDGSRTASDVFSGRAGPLKMLVPQITGNRSQEYSPIGLNGLNENKRKESAKKDDLSWYDDYMQQKMEGKWDPEPRRNKESELKSVLSDRWTESRESVPGPGARTLRMKPSTYDGLTPYEDYRVQFHMMAELNGWDKTAKALYLAGCLSKGARSVLNDLRHEDRYDYDKLDEALRERYGTEDQAELFKA